MIMSELRVCMLSIIYSVNLLRLPESWFVQAFSLANRLFSFSSEDIEYQFFSFNMRLSPVHWGRKLIHCYSLWQVPLEFPTLMWHGLMRSLTGEDTCSQVSYQYKWLSPSSLHCVTTNTHYSKPYTGHYSQHNTTTDNKGRLLSKVQLQWQNEYQEGKVACNSGRILRSRHTLYSFFLHRFCMRNRFKISSWVFKMFDESLQSFSLILIFEIFIPEESHCKHLTYTKTQEVLHSTWPTI